MPKLRAIVSLLALLGAVVIARGAEKAEEWIIESPGGAVFNQHDGTLTLSNEVTIRYGGAVLKARRAQLNQITGECVAEGDVRLEGEGKVWNSDKLRYNFRTRRIVGEDFKTGQPPYFARGEVFVGEQSQGVYLLMDGLLTTDDNADPNYHIKAKIITIVPGNYIECEDATAYLGDVPIFWWPKLRRSLQTHRNFWTVTPGYRNKYGPYVLSTYETYWNDKLRTRLHLDERVTRGPGVGPDVLYNLPHFGEGEIKYYYTYDDKPDQDLAGNDIAHNRQRVWYEHQGTIQSNLTLKAAVHYQSDSQIIRDFFVTEFHNNSQPATYVELAQNWNNWILDAMAQPRVNDFQETVERLPDVRLTGLRQQLGPTPFYYESESSFGYFQREFAYDLTNRYSATRADTFHQIVMPLTFFNWLTVTPRAGGRYTYYGEANGPGAATEERERWVFNTGAEVTTKLSRTWPGAHSSALDLDGLRHVIQPSVNYAYVPNPSVPFEELPQFDYELPTTRLLPITFPDYDRIDSIDSQNVVRFGLRNRLQTKRSGQLVNFVNWSTYVDWRLRPNSNQRTYSDAYSDLDLRPTRWLTFSSQLAYDINETVLDVADHAAVISPNDAWSLRLAHRYLRDGAFFGPTVPGHNLFYETLYLRFNQNWGTRMSHYYNADDGFLQHQYYTIYRDFRSFTVGLTAAIRKSLGQSTDFGVGFTISSKAFPRFGIGDDVNKPNLLLGY